jgi:hypothetical protein
MCDGMIMMFYSMVLMDLTCVEDGIKVDIGVGQIDVSLLLGGLCSEEWSYRIVIAMICWSCWLCDHSLHWSC